MRGSATLGGILALLLLLGLAAGGEEAAEAAEVEETLEELNASEISSPEEEAEEAADGEDPWAKLTASTISTMVEVRDISGRYADITEGAYIKLDENDTSPHPYLEEEGTYIWTIEQHGSILTGTIESSDGESYPILGSTIMDELSLVYFGTGTDVETNVTYEIEGVLEGKILESGQIVLKGIGYEYIIKPGLDPEEADDYTFNGYFAETTILTPIDE